MLQKIANTSTKTNYFFFFKFLLSFFCCSSFPQLHLSSSQTHPYRKRDNSYNQTSPHNLLEFEQLFQKWGIFHLPASWHDHDIYTEMQSSGPFQKEEKNIEIQNEKKPCWNSLIFFIIFFLMFNKIFFYY